MPGTETSTNLHQKLYFHVLGTPQSDDVLCAEFPDNPKWMSGAEVCTPRPPGIQRRAKLEGFYSYSRVRRPAVSLQVSDDGRYVLLSIREGCDPVNRLWYCDLKATSQGITGLFPVSSGAATNDCFCRTKLPIIFSIGPIIFFICSAYFGLLFNRTCLILHTCVILLYCDSF